MAPATTFRFTLATAHRVIDRVHNHSAHVRATSLPASPAGLATGDVHVVDVADLANRGETILVDPAHFARGHFYQRVTAFKVVQNRLLTGAPCDLSAATRAQLDIVNARSKRNGPEWQGIAKFGCSIVAGTDFRSDLKTVRGQDVADFAIAVLNKSDSGRAIGIVFDADYFRGYAMFPALEINLAIMLFVTAANVA